MFAMLKFSLYFFLSFSILSIPIKKQTMFEHLHSLTSPYTDKVFQAVYRTSSEAFSDASDWGKKLFTNSKPDYDSVSSKQAAVEKEEVLHQDYTAEEKELLLKILNDQ